MNENKNECRHCKKEKDCPKKQGRHNNCFEPGYATNYDLIRNMNLEEMAEFLGQKPYCTLYESDCIYGWHENDCKAHAIEWLKSKPTE